MTSTHHSSAWMSWISSSCAAIDRDRLLVLQQRRRSAITLRRCRSNGSPRSTPSWALSTQHVEPLGVLVLGVELVGQLGHAVGERGQVTDRQRLPRLAARGTSRPARRCGRTRKLFSFIEAIASRSTPATSARSSPCASMRVEGLDQLEAGLEDLLAQRHAARRRRRAARSWLKYSRFWQKSKTLNSRLVVAGPEQVGAQAGAAADHLPELGLRADQLEEHEVDALGHVDAGVEHVDRDRDVRRLVLDREVVDQALAVLHAVGDDPGEVAVVEVRVVGDEPFVDEVGVALVLGEDDRLAEPVAAGDLDARGSSGVRAPCRRCPR